MKGFYLRWAGILLGVVLLAFLGTLRYQREVSTVSPAYVLATAPEKPVRVQGMVQAGSLRLDQPRREAWFVLEGDEGALRVHYQGPDMEEIRELRHLVIGGVWNPEQARLEGRSLALPPRYGFVTAAYAVGLLPTLLFLFHMERRVRLLYNEIRETKPYLFEEDSP